MAHLSDQHAFSLPFLNCSNPPSASPHPHHRKLSKPEYVLLWLTFLAIMWSGLELGIAAGIVMVTLVFAYEYAQSTVSSINPLLVTSGTVYSYSHMSLLDLIMPRCGGCGGLVCEGVGK